MVMARYGISADPVGTVSPVNMDIEYSNLGMMYESWKVYNEETVTH